MFDCQWFAAVKANEMFFFSLVVCVSSAAVWKSTQISATSYLFVLEISLHFSTFIRDGFYFGFPFQSMCIFGRHSSFTCTHASSLPRSKLHVQIKISIITQNCLIRSHFEFIRLIIAHGIVDWCNCSFTCKSLNDATRTNRAQTIHFCAFFSKLNSTAQPTRMVSKQETVGRNNNI